MTEKPYLLTYQDEKRGYGTFAWFDTEEEMDEFIDNNNINVIEAYYITAAQELNK